MQKQQETICGSCRFADLGQGRVKGVVRNLISNIWELHEIQDRCHT